MASLLSVDQRVKSNARKKLNSSTFSPFVALLSYVCPHPRRRILCRPNPPRNRRKGRRPDPEGNHPRSCFHPGGRRSCLPGLCLPQGNPCEGSRYFQSDPRLSRIDPASCSPKGNRCPECRSQSPRHPDSIAPSFRPPQRHRLFPGSSQQGRRRIPPRQLRQTPFGGRIRFSPLHSRRHPGNPSSRRD